MRSAAGPRVAGEAERRGRGAQDPGNVGTLLRSAVGFGWDAAALIQVWVPGRVRASLVGLAP